MMLHTKYQGSGPCGFKEEDFFMFSSYRPMLNMCSPGWANFWPQGHNLNKLGRGPLDDTTYEISML